MVSTMTNVFTEGNIQKYYSIFCLISASEKEAIYKVFALQLLLSQKKVNKVRASQSLNNFIVKQLSSKDWLSDKRINLSQELHYNRFSLTKGLEDT